MSMRAGAGGDRKEAVIALRLAVRFALLGLDHANEPRLEQTAELKGGIEQDQNIERIAVRPARGWDEAEVIGKGVALRQDGLEAEHAQVRVIGVFVPAALGGLDHHVEVAVRVESRKLRKGRHRSRVPP